LRLVVGEPALASTMASEALSIAEELDDPRGIAWSLEVFAAAAAVAGRVEQSARLWGASDGLLERVGSSLAPTIGWLRDRYLAPAQTSLGAELFDARYTEGRVLRAGQAAALAKQLSP
jgi:non-specific serine/threonine protein kinase